MPEASVKRDSRALSGIIGRKASVGGLESLWLNIQSLTLEMPEILLN